jgi:hypothetical protein
MELDRGQTGNVVAARCCNTSQKIMSHQAIVVEVEKLKDINPVTEGFWFETESPGPLPPGRTLHDVDPA